MSQSNTLSSSAQAVHTNLDVLATSRYLLVKLLRSLPAETLTRVPEGFNNHILWNAAHLLVTQQLLCYKMSGLPMYVDDATVELFRKGSGPTEAGDAIHIDAVLGPLQELVETARKDYDAGRFTEFEVYTTSTGFTLDSVESAIAFNNFHEGVHMGSIMALRRALG